MDADLKTISAGGALTILLLREVFRFIKDREPRKPNGHEKAHAETMMALQSLRAVVDIVRGDTEHLRATSHRIANDLSAQRTATDLMIRLLESQRH